MNATRRQRSAAIAILITALAAGSAGYWFGQATRVVDQQRTQQSTAASKPDEREVLYWYDPMVPQQHFDQPGKSPFMDMQLVPRYAEVQTATLGVHIALEAAQRLGMREVLVQRAPFAQRINASGTIELDGRALSVIQARSAGFVERVWPIAVGDMVDAGAPLATLRLPEWKGAADEWLAVTRNSDASMRTAATERLRQLGMPEADIAALARNRSAVSLYRIAAPTAGVVREVALRPGMAVSAGQSLFTINGMSSVWLMVAVPESSIAQLHVGDTAQAKLTALPGRVVSGRVAAILPVLATATRTVQLRIELANPHGVLRPGLSAQVQIETTDTTPVLSVPTEALIRTGQRTLVMRADGAGRYSPIIVQVGREVGARTEVLAGLQNGQRIVASGQFLLDSEASLLGVAPRAAVAR